MSSSPRAFRDSSPAGAPGRRRSQFTYRHLALLASYSTSCPLRVIAHLDLDAFYAQCEMVRLGTDLDQPLAVQQWQGLIAINYPARKFNIGRHCTVTEAKKLCPKLIAQHVATWKEGDEKWAYHEDAAANIATHKVSLDPYRLQSRRILAVIKDFLPANLQKVEKASIDEVFMDLSAHVHSILLERFPELARPPPYDDPMEKLPLPSVSALDWKADALVDLDDADMDMDDPDWDDIAILIGSEIVRDVRAAIWEQLKYTSSAGIASNKMLSKLGSGYKKPNQQTVIRSRATKAFVSSFKFTKIRNLGGKLGDQVVQHFNTDMVEGLLEVSMDQLKAKLGDDTGVWVYNTIRGIDSSEVNSRTQIKSMLSAKSFRPSINTFEQGSKWLRIFAADIFSRLVEEGVLENKRRPKTINLHHRHGGQTRSRQSPIPQGKTLDEETLYALAKNLFSQIILEGNVWPCANLSLSVGGFEDGITGNMGIGAFLVKGEEAQQLRLTSRESTDEGGQEDKRRRLENGGIQRFFSKRPADVDDAAASENGGETNRSEDSPQAEAGRETGDAVSSPPRGGAGEDHQGVHDSTAPFVCTRCDMGFDTSEASRSHDDWHFAKDLQDEEERRVSAAFAGRSSSAATTHPTPNNAKKKAGTSSARAKKAEQGQTKLSFG